MGARLSLPQKRLHLRPALLDRVHVGRVRRQEQDLRAHRLDQLPHDLDLVRPEVVHHDDVACAQHPEEGVPNPLDEVHDGGGPGQRIDRDESRERQSSNERDVLPPLARLVDVDTLARQRTPVPWNEGEVGPELVQEDQVSRVESECGQYERGPQRDYSGRLDCVDPRCVFFE